MLNDATESTAHNTAVRSRDGIPTNIITLLEAQSSVPRANFFSRLFGRSPIPPALRTQYRMARGEVSIVDVLSQLGPEWLVRTCGANAEGVEHVVIGPPGIFCMVVRHRPGAAMWIDGGVILADGERLPYLRDAEFSAVRLTQLLSDAVGSRVEATPCLVLVGPRSVTVAKPPRRVAVLTVRDIRRWLKEMPAVISGPDLDAIKVCAEAQSDWHSLASRTVGTQDALDSFRRLHAEVGQARHVRLTWVTGALVLLWLVAVVGIGGVTTSLLVR